MSDLPPRAELCHDVLEKGFIPFTKRDILVCWSKNLPLSISIVASVGLTRQSFKPKAE